jgi:flagellar biosynthesis/type III secretory pathway M-ring protein FliF/YscJ
MAEDEFDLTDDFDDEFEEVAPEEIAAPEDTSVLTKKRKIILAVLVGVLLVGGVLITMTLRKGPSAPKNSMSSINVQQQEKPEKEVKKKKKRKKVKYKILFSQLEPEATTKILRELTFAEINYTTEQNGKKYTVLIDEDELSQARNLLAIKGLPSGAVQGYELLDSGATLGVTEFDKRIRFLRALSGELEKGILQFEMIESAKVQIVLPEQRLFAVTQPPVTASILIRRKKGADITDEIVFSIIKLVSNAVENLQPENVSVIDTLGMVLSQGVFERIAARKAGELIEEEEVEEEVDGMVVTKEDAMGHPIIPNYESIDLWFDMKWKFEKELELKAMKQLMGILPLGSFKIAVSSDVGPVLNGEIVDIKRLTISIVVDGMNDDVYLDADTKTQIFSTVAGSVGYVRGRDSIQLSRADFTLFSEKELKELEKLTRPSFSFFKFFGSLLLVAVLGAGAYFLGLLIKKRREQSTDIKSFGDKERESDFESLKSELNDEKSTDRLKLLANDEPELIAQIMENWLGISDTVETENEETTEEVSEEVAVNED